MFTVLSSVFSLDTTAKNDSTLNNTKEGILAIYAATSPATASLLPNRTVNVGDTMHVPIHLTGSSIFNMVFYITYDHGMLTPYSVPYMSVHPSFSVTAYNANYNATTLIIMIDSRNFPGVSFTGQKIADLVFTCVSPGTTSMHLRKSPDPSPRCGIWDEVGISFNPVTYSDNLITVSSGISAVLTVQGVNIGAGQINCYNATQTINIAGFGTTFNVQGGGSVTMIAGQNIFYYPGTTVQTGGYMHGYIAPSGPWCGTQAPALASVTTGEYEQPQSSSRSPSFVLYPNPTYGSFTVDLVSEQAQESGIIEVFDMHGVRVLFSDLTGGIHQQFSIRTLQTGVYLVRLTLTNETITTRLIQY